MAASSPVPPAERGLLDALRAVARTLNEMFQVRGALFALELREEVARRKSMLLLAVLGAAFLQMALLLLAAFVVALFWDTYRIAAVGAVAALYLACGLAAFAALRSRLAASPEPFAATLGELRLDLEQVRPSA